MQVTYAPDELRLFWLREKPEDPQFEPNVGINMAQVLGSPVYIEYRSDDVTKNFICIQLFGYHVSVEHDEKHPQSKFGGDGFMGARDMAAWIPN